MPDNHEDRPIEAWLADWRNQVRDEAVERLTNYWEELNDDSKPRVVVKPARPKRRSLWRIPLTGLAVASVIGFVAWLVSGNNPQRQPDNSTRRRAEANSNQTQANPSPALQNRPSKPAVAQSGTTPSTLIDRVIATMAVQRHRGLNPLEHRDLLTQLRRLKNEDLSVEQLAQRLKIRPATIQTTVGRAYSEATDSERRLLFELTRRVSGSESTALLRSWQYDEGIGLEAFAELAHRSTAIQVGRQLLRERHIPRQQVLLNRLLQSEHSAGIGIFLNFVRDQRTRQVALQTLQQSKQPPVDLLLSYFDSRNYRDRISAGLAIGAILDARLTQDMIGLVVNGRHRPEALCALVVSSQADATVFIRQAQANHRLAPMVISVIHQLQHLH